MLENNEKLNNELVGISAELAIAEYFDVPISEEYKNRGSKEVTDIIKTSLKEYQQINNFTNWTFVANGKGKRGKHSKSSIDFYANINGKNSSISVKSNIHANSKVCPPEIGQPSIATFNELFCFPRNLEIKTKQDFKKIVFEQINELLFEYLKMLFYTDYIFHFQKNNEKYNLLIVESKILRKFSFDSTKISFTKNSVEEWNESNTVKYNGKSIGEFQVHKNRNSLKFRFNFKNLLELINSVQNMS